MAGRIMDKEQQMAILNNKAASIRLVALDVDGVLTDGCIHMGNEREAFKSFFAKDGLAISLALRSGITVAIITGRCSSILQRRMAELGVREISEGVKDKGEAIRKLAKKYDMGLDEIAFMGYDLNDLPALVQAGLSAAPADAVPEVRERAALVTVAPGGRGAVRELLELILKARDMWDLRIREYLEAGQGDRQ